MTPTPQQDDFSDLAEIKLSKDTSQNKQPTNNTASTNPIRERKFFVKDGQSSAHGHDYEQKPMQQPQRNPASSME